MSALTPRQAAFCVEYLVDLNATQAAVRAGYSERTAKQQGARLLTNVDVAAEIQRLMAARSERTEITVDEVLRELWSIAMADPNDLIEFRRRCCRHCWGKGHRRQETPAERERRRREYDREMKRQQRDDPYALIERFDPLGGIGWDPRKDAYPACPECFGEGVGDAVIKDSARAPEAARKLYAGVKLTKDGLQVLTHNKVDALVHVGRHLGMFPTKVEASGPGGGPIETVTRIERTIVRPPARDPDS